MTDAFVLDYVRTPRGRASARGALHEHSPVDLVVHLAKALQGRTNLAAEQIDDVVLGCASQVDEQGANIARTAALLAGWGDSVPGATLNRFCASGVDAVGQSAARTAGGDINMNPRLRLAIDKAKAANMPADNIKRNVDKATGNLEGVSYEEIRYEGYGIGGAAIIVDTMTDNRVRTVAEVRHAFSKHGGNLGTEGSVAFQFKNCGQLIFAPGTNEDKVMEVALEAGAEDVITDDDGAIEVLSAPSDFEAVKNALEAAGLTPEVAEVTMRPENTIALSGDDAARMQKLLDVLEDLDDVQNVFHNAEISE